MAFRNLYEAASKFIVNLVACSSDIILIYRKKKFSVLCPVIVIIVGLEYEQCRGKTTQHLHKKKA